MALLLASCLAGLLLCEAGLRLFHPKYKHLAEAPLIRDPNLLFARKPSHCSFHLHRESRAPHPLCHNNLGLRQHRDFSALDLESSINIGFFGDSFTENISMAAPFSFTEPLDYLLNTGGRRINVLNFGVHGYSTSQSLRRYETWDLQETLDHVLYVYYENDLKDNLASPLFRLDEAGQLATEEEAFSASFGLLSKLHLSYLALDVAGRLRAHLEDSRAKVPEREPAIEIGPATGNGGASGVARSEFALFRQLLRRWKEAVENNGARFHLVWPPMETRDFSSVAAIAKEEGIQILNLRDCFGERDLAHLRTPWLHSPYRFKPGLHWNEAGNRLAALCLHRFLEGALELPWLPEKDLELALRRYYSAFEAEASAGWGAGRGDAPRMKTASRPASPQAAAIREKYNSPQGDWADAPALWALSPDKLAIRSRFNLFLYPDDGWMAYIKEGCEPADFDARFFLHVFPTDVRDLPPHRQEHGFDNLDFSGKKRARACSVWMRLPGYAIERIVTGQFSVDGSGGREILWQGEHVFRFRG